MVIVLGNSASLPSGRCSQVLEMRCFAIKEVLRIIQDSPSSTPPLLFPSRPRWRFPGFWVLSGILSWKLKYFFLISTP